LAEYIERSARVHPGRTAVVAADGASLNYAQLDEQADRVAGFLRDHGVKPGDRVGIYLRKGIEAVVAIFATLKAGAAYVPVDVGAPASRCATILDDRAVRAVFLDEAQKAVLDEWPTQQRPELLICRCGSPFSASCYSFAEATEAARLPVGSVARGPDQLAYILYTSGSTGSPKGVMLTQENATSFVEWCADVFAPSADDRFSSHAPFHFDLSIFDLYVSLRQGASLHLIPHSLTTDPRGLARFVAKHQITIWYSTPSALTLLSQFGKLEATNYRGPRIVLFAGEVFPVKHLRAITRQWTQATWYNLYGPTETNVCTLTKIPTPIPPEREEPFPIGEACHHCHTLVVDEQNRSVDVGSEGSLLVAGPSVFSGYWNRAAENQRVFRQLAGTRYYDTGDVVRVTADESLVFVGRRDRMVKRLGYRIELGEIETALYRHPRLRQVALTALADEDRGTRIVASLVTDQQQPSMVELKVFCSQHLPAYMIPDAFRFVSRLPTTSTGKTDHQAILSEIQSS
jgi:amino acid adenylation domain-containing protein